jgi:hypothetical protein
MHKHKISTHILPECIYLSSNEVKQTKWKGWLHPICVTIYVFSRPGNTQNESSQLNAGLNGEFLVPHIILFTPSPYLVSPHLESDPLVP